MAASYIVELPVENHTTEIMYACKECATHALTLIHGGSSFPVGTAFPCEFFYEGICREWISGQNRPESRV